MATYSSSPQRVAQHTHLDSQQSRRSLRFFGPGDDWSEMWKDRTRGGRSLRQPLQLRGSESTLAHLSTVLCGYRIPIRVRDTRELRRRPRRWKEAKRREGTRLHRRVSLLGIGTRR